MKKLIVCGDSWMSPNNNHPDTHFAEIFAKKLGFELIVYAHPGMSNGGISAQLNTAIQNKPDLILFNSTSFDRIEFIRDINLEKKADNPLNTFNVSDLLYLHNENNDHASLVSYSMNSLLDEQSKPNFNGLIPDLEKKLKAVKEFVSELYYPLWKYKMDSMIMYAIANRLHLSNIPYVYCFDRIQSTQQPNDYNWLWMQSKNFIPELNDVTMRTKIGEQDPGYHTSYETQVELADVLIAHYSKYF